MIDRLRRLPMPLIVGVVAVLAILLGAGGYVLFAAQQPEPVAEATQTPSPTPTPRPTRSPRPTPTDSPTPSSSPTPQPSCPLNGLPLADPTVIERPTLLVQIENHPNSRPASNLTRADLVIEAPVEGDTTRFSALFLCQGTEGLTGPVRSARYYSVHLWQMMHALTVGIGASPGGYGRFANAGMPYVDAMQGWPWFGRISSRAAPHNLYVDVEAMRSSLGAHEGLDALAEQAGTLRPPFEFAADANLPSERAVSGITIWTNSFWTFGWRWDPELGVYHRSDAGAEHVDAASGDPYTAKTVVVQLVTQETVFGDPDPGGYPRRDQHLVGEGTGTVYHGGQAVALRWSRPSADDATTWTFAESGEPLVLPPGTVWWEIIPTTASLQES